MKRCDGFRGKSNIISILLVYTFTRIFRVLSLLLYMQYSVLRAVPTVLNPHTVHTVLALGA